jgi:hypothetical protein
MMFVCRKRCPSANVSTPSKYVTLNAMRGRGLWVVMANKRVAIVYRFHFTRFRGVIVSGYKVGSTPFTSKLSCQKLGHEHGY